MNRHCTGHRKVKLNRIREYTDRALSLMSWVESNGVPVSLAS